MWVNIFFVWLAGIIIFYSGIFVWSKYVFLKEELIETRTTLDMYKNMLVTAARGHDTNWDYEELGDPNDCDQCNYDGMKEVLREGRRISIGKTNNKSI